jgi:hypothetical protein
MQERELAATYVAAFFRILTQIVLSHTVDSGELHARPVPSRPIRRRR